jgi:predicted esterase
MYQRLLFILLTVFISGAATAQDVMTSADGDYVYNAAAAADNALHTNPTLQNGVVQKWVRDPSQKNRIGWDQTKFKSYHYGNTSFRIRFPNNYDPSNPAKYPLVLFFHGAGEAPDHTLAHNLPANRENQDHLFWGAQIFEQRMDQGEWNGFLFFPQVMDNSSQWDASNPAFGDITNILDTLQKYNGFDPDRLITMGLSAGGVGTVNYAKTYPQRVASIVTSNPRFIETNIDPSIVSTFLQIPIWVAFGGVDDFPGPADVMRFRDSVSKYGGNVYATYHGSQGHSSWSLQWVQRDLYGKYILSTYWNAASKAQPLLYYQQSQFCNGSPISAKMGLTPGFAAYEWQYDGGGGFVTIPGAINSTYTATQAGRYQARFKRSLAGAWSAWSPNPVVLSNKTCLVGDTAFAEHFEGTPINDYITFAGGGGFSNSSYFKGNYECENGVFVNGTESYSQDATGRLGGRFMVNNTLTLSGATCPYAVGDQVWRTYNNAAVTPNTDYIFSFYIGNGANGAGTNGTSPATPLTQLSAKINGVVLSPATAQTVSSGDVSWKKYVFTWNSGSNTSAELAVVNNIATTTGNSFALDEITLVKSKGIFPEPGLAYNQVSLWAKANTISGSDGTPVGLWTNSNANSNNLAQPSASALPTFQNDAGSNMNFNPVVNFNANNGQFMQTPSGFSGTTSHSAVTAYIVARFPNTTQNDKNVLIERQTAVSNVDRIVKVTLNSSGRISWTAGADPNDGGTFVNTVTTPNNSIDVNVPTVWTFSKDNANTASGNKQDIRKNGVVIASGTSTATYTGNNSNFGLTNGGQFFTGDVAEVIYLVDSTVTPARQNKIESYLALKYGTTLGSQSAAIDYTASDGTTIFWPGASVAANAKFQRDVFGIGTDSASGLVQTISNSVNSGSGDGTGQAGKGNLVLSANTTLLDKRFLMIGNSGASLAQQVIASGNALLIGSTRVGRNWKVDNTNSVGAVTLSFDTTGLGPQSGGAVVNKYALLISNTGDTTYSGTVSFFNATAASGKKIIFSGVTLADGATFTILTNNLNIALPAVWLGFTAEAVNGNGLLKWKTSDEINVATYTVEHSFNGVSFSAVGSVAANNNSGINNYSFTHAGLAPGIHYYRIRRTDKDGKFEFSDIKSIKITTNGANVQVRPNPVVGSTLVLAVSIQQNNKSNIQVTGVDGKVIAEQVINLAAGNNMVNINISSVPPGIYLVRVQLADEVVTRKFIKER